MGWGSAIANAYQQATDTAKAAASKAAQTAQSAYDYAENKARQAADAAQAGYDYTKQKAGEAYDYGKQKAVETYEYGKQKAVEGYEYGKQKAVDAYHAGQDAAAYAAEKAKKAVRDAKLDAIKARYESARKSLGQEAAGSPVKMCPKVAANCAKLKEALNKAELAKDSYNDKPPSDGKTIGGYRRLDPNNPKDAKELKEKLGVAKSDLEPDGLDFRARVYAKTVNGKTEYVIGYRGTQTGADWKENVRQGSGMVNASAQDPASQSSYDLAVRLAKKAAEKTEANGDLLSYTGHSLGGGMASAAAAMTSSQGVSHSAATFNAAGLNAQTLGGSYPNPPAMVDAYFTPTDPLSALQDNRPLVLGGLTKATSSIPVLGPMLATALGGWVVGNEVSGTPIMPKAYGKRHILPFPPKTEPPDLSVDGLIQGHGMDLVIDGIKTERTALGCPG